MILGIVWLLMLLLTRQRNFPILQKKLGEGSKPYWVGVLNTSKLLRSLTTLSMTVHMIYLHTAQLFPIRNSQSLKSQIVDRGHRHCKILDNEGSKFIHSNPYKKIITMDSIVMAQYYFPNGVIYKELALLIPKIHVN